MAIARLLEQENCQAYFYLGDIIYPNGITSADDPRLSKLFLNVYRPIFEKKDMFLTLGNHDYQGNVDAWLEVAKRHPKLHYPAHYYVAKINDICLPMLNTTDFKLRQVAWLRSLDLRSCKENILVGHHPIKSSGKHKKAYFPLSLFLDYALSYANVYISGHDHHLSYEGEHKGTHQFVSGAAGQLRPLDEKKTVWGKSQLGYLVVSGEAGNLDFSFWGLKKEGGKELLFTKKISNRALANE